MKAISFIPFILLLIGCNIASAQSRSEQEALQIAESFFKSKVGNIEPKLSIVPKSTVARHMSKRIKSNGEQNGYYIVNDTNNHRFVIVSADERMFDILGYSDNTLFDAASVPDALLSILTGYNSQYRMILSNEVEVAQIPVNANVVPIPYMIKTQWHQDAPFNNDCPLDEDGERCVTGCVATAMAQVMNYYKKPENGFGGNVSYEANPFKLIDIGQSFDYDTLIIDWNQIIDKYDSRATEIQIKEVAKLMHACGVSVYMGYGSSSGADDADIAYAMIHNFNYNPNMYYADKKYYDISEWHALIQKELKEGRPILYASNAHEYILDGMDESGMYHFNFGWAGSGDGHYVLDAITPVETTLKSDQTMVVGIVPDTIGVHKDIFFCDEFILDTLVEVNKQAKIIKFEPMCFSNQANTFKGEARFRGEYGVGLFNKDFQFIKSLFKYQSSFTARSYQGRTTGDGNKITFDTATFLEGSQFYIAPYAQGKATQHPTLIRTKGGLEDWYRATVKNGQVILELKELISDELLGDSNGDGVIDVADIVSIVNYIMQHPSADFIFANSDLNKDGEIDVADITLLISIIMKQ